MSSQESPTFRYFTDPQERGMIAECGFRLAQYVLDEQVGTVVLVDKAARNLHIAVRAAHRSLSPDARAPGIYFLNPAGFYTPELHNRIEYGKRLFHAEAEATGQKPSEVASIMRSNPSALDELLAKADKIRDQDRREDARQKVTERFKPLFDRAVELDPTFNDRVMVVDACVHEGTSLFGIVNTLRDVGVDDVRSAAVNNRSNVGSPRLDFIVFNNNEIPDTCKPFGPQEGLMKGGGETQVCRLADEGLSVNSLLARSELDLIMQKGSELREEFLTRPSAYDQDQMVSIIRRLIGF